MEKWRDELYHYGVLGQKWGIRRYQNYDGSYTRRGLEHYNRTKKGYEDARKFRKEVSKAVKEGRKSITVSDGSGSQLDISLDNPKSALRLAKQYEKDRKRAMNKNYKQLKLDYKADKGKALYNEGHTISGNEDIAGFLAMGTLLGSGAAAKLLKNKGDVYIRSINTRVPVNALASGAIALGGGAVNALFSAKSAVDNSNLRAYYSHSSNYAE